MNLFPAIASSITPASSLPFSSPLGDNADKTGPSFGEALQNAISSVNSQQIQAGQLASDFAVGKTSDVHGVMIASQQATIALQLATEVRNKAVEAYQEVMRITM